MRHSLQFPTLRLASSPTGRARLRSHRARRFANLAKTMLHVVCLRPGRALPGVRKPASSVRGTCIVVPHAALLAVPDAPPRFFAHRARSAPVPQGTPVCEPSQVQCCTLADHGPGAQNPVWFQKEEPPHVWGFFLLESGSVLLSRAVTSQVPSALKGLTSVFGMGTGGSLSP